MNRLLFGFSVIFSVVVMVGVVHSQTLQTPSTSLSSPALIQQSGTISSSSNGSTIAVSVMLPDGNQQVVVIDQSTHSMATYLIESGSGKIVLRGVRDIQWDLQMEEFNAISPTPAEIRMMVQGKGS